MNVVFSSSFAFKGSLGRTTAASPVSISTDVGSIKEAGRTVDAMINAAGTANAANQIQSNLAK